MDDSIFSEIGGTLSQFGVTAQQVERLYPNMFDSTMNLSVTGVSPRTYFYWKKAGLVGPLTDSSEDKGWVKINLIEYIWIKLIETMRDFGVPFETIKETREMLFSNWIDILMKRRDESIEYLKQNTTLNKKKLDALNEILIYAKKELENSPEEFEIYHTPLATIIIELLIQNDKGYVVISKNVKDYEVNYFSWKSLSDYQNLLMPIFDMPSLHIPIRNLVIDFLDNPKNEKYLETINLLNLKEMKVIKAIREKDFKEIVIKQDGKKESIIIKVEKDGVIIDEKAKEVKRILGLNEYSEVTIKFRNDKNLYFKNKTQL